MMLGLLTTVSMSVMAKDAGAEKKRVSGCARNEDAPPGRNPGEKSLR